MVDGTVADTCTRIGPSYEKYPGERLSYCYFLEFMWHVIFGEPDDLPLRSEDQRLPLALRMKDNEQDIPVWKSSVVRAYWSGKMSSVSGVLN